MGMPALDEIGRPLPGLGMAAPAAPAPAAAPVATPPQGLGMTQPAAPPQKGLLDTPGASGPEDLSDYSGLLANIGMRVRNALTANAGMGLASDHLRAIRQQQNDRRQKAMGQAFDLTKEIGETLSKTPQREIAAKSALLRKYFVQRGGTGAEEFYDAFVGDPGNWFGQTEAAKADPGMQAILANPNSTPQMILARSASPEYMALGAKFQDEKNMPIILAKIAKQRANPSKEYRDAEAAAVASDKGMTIDKFLALQEFAPDSERLDITEITTARRNEEQLSQVHGFRSEAAVKAAQAADEKLKRDEELQTQKDAAALERVKYGVDNRPLPTAQLPRPISGTATANLAVKVAKDRMKYMAMEADIDQLLHAPKDGIGDYETLLGFIHQIDNTAAKEGEVVFAQSATSLTDRLKRFIANKVTGDKLGPDQRAAIRTILEQSKQRIRGLHASYLKMNVPIFNKGVGAGTPDQLIPGWRDFIDPKEQERLMGGEALSRGTATPQPPDATQGAAPQDMEGLTALTRQVKADFKAGKISEAEALQRMKDINANGR